ncbi:hypothetical protein DFH06DRAFT_1324921 [Mycena polygramma]|nr:hypothetical protein DFH06DRAFT_1324921 [Mycena polygramma]
MSTSNSSAARNSKSDAPFALQRRRTLLACTNCRRRKMRCITTEQPPKNPCARCTKKGLTCEYVAADQDEYSPELPTSSLPQPATRSGHGASNPTRTNQPMPPPSNFSLGLGPAPPLPYTGPPPPFQRPRYSGTQYPDLSLQGSDQQNPSSQHYSAQATQGYDPQSAQVYQYINPGILTQQHGAQQPGSGGYPAGYEQMQYYGNTPTPDYGWPPQQGSSSSRYPGNDPRYR